LGPISQSYGDPIPGAEKKLTVTVGIIVLVFLSLAFYFWNLQILKNTRYQILADNNRIRLVQMPATRGIITDRNGVILADSAPCYSVAFIPEDITGDLEDSIVSLANILGRDADDAIKAYHGNDTGIPYRTIKIFEHLDSREVALFEAEQDLFPGAVLLVEPRRYYPFGQTASHLLGYVGEISGSQIASGRYPGAIKGDIIGKYALEKHYDSYLRGRDGGRQVEVDSRGREISILGVTEPSPGANVHLTLDVRIQRELEQALGENRGAGVVLMAGTGEVLAMVSEPSFDPNEFSLRLSKERWKEIMVDPGHPLQNRTVQGMYPPGSTFKVVTAIASLMEGTIKADELLNCSGGYYFGRRVYRDWKLSGHGKVDLRKGIVESCDVYFYQAGERTGMDALAKWASVLGLGRQTGIDLPGEAQGLVPSPDWKLKTRDEVWFPGETLSAAIGQGYVLVTPLQLANLYATIARKGVQMDPFIVSEIESIGGMELYRRDPMVRRELEIPLEVWMKIIDALEGVVSDPSGTGRVSRIPGVSVAGKTGTAQVVRLQEVQADEEVPYELRDHGWFVAFAPAHDPKIVAAVVVEHGGHGSSSAAPVVARVLKKCLEFYPSEMQAAETPEEGR
jgi:penicillin-binding protein 2